MNEIQRHHLLCIARIDLSTFVNCPDGEDESLFATAVPAGPWCWEGLLEAAAPRESDDRTDNGYVIKAWFIPIAKGHFRETAWIDPSYDQWERICDYVSDWSQRAEPTPEPH